jgi:hypothetical protein
MATSSNSSSVSVQIDVSAVRRLGADLRAADPVAARTLRLGLKSGADLVAAEARNIASGFSTRIPQTIKASASGYLSAKVKAGASSAPHAAALENHGFSGTFKHPLFGDRTVWVQQSAQPFLAPAADRNAVAVEGIVVSAVKSGFAALGLDF